MNEDIKSFKDKIKFFEPKSDQKVEAQSKNKSVVIQNIVIKKEEHITEYPKDLLDYEKKSKNIIHPIKESQKIEQIDNKGQVLNIYHYLNKNISNDAKKRTIGILFVGQSGAGKSTLINSYTNFLLGVTHNLPYRYKIVIENKERDKTISQTEEITVYILETPLYPGIIFKLIDTPGIGDTESENRINQDYSDKKYLEKFEEFFNKKLLEKELELTLVICFVVKAAENRIGNYQKEIFSSILRLFGKNIGNNLLALFTHSDSDEPNAIQLLTNIVNEFEKKEKKNCKWYWCFSSKIYFQTKKGRLFEGIYNENIENFISFTREIIKMREVDISLTKKNLFLNKLLNELKKNINELLFRLLDNYQNTDDKNKINENNINLEKDIIKQLIKMKIIVNELKKIEIKDKNNLLKNN